MQIRFDPWVRSPAARQITMAVITCVGGWFRFYGLHWNDGAWPHPDERAMVSQTHDMLARDHYQPTIHTWGHLGYYAALFALKVYVGVQRVAPVPHLRDLSENSLAVGGMAGVLVICAVAVMLQRLRPAWRLASLVAVGLLGLASWRATSALLLAPISPHFDDVALMGRLVGASVSTLSLPVLYALGARLYSPAVGLLGAAFFAVSLRPIQLSHFFAVEPLQTFAVLLALWAAAALWTMSAQAPRPSRAIPGIPLLYVALGLAIGAAMASKFSAGPLLVLPAVVHLLLLRRDPPWPPLLMHASFVLSYVAALGLWFHAHPYAWENAFEPFASARLRPILSDRWLHVLFSREFAAQIAEQGRMVQGVGGGPWVQQFVDSTPYVTLTLEMIRWSFGWPLGLVCVGGTTYLVWRNLVRPSAADWLLLSYALTTFLIIGSFKATFPRYTLPLMAVACLFGARTCVIAGTGRAWRSRAAVAVAAIVIVSSVLYCAAYMRVYSTPHAWTSASLWIFRNVPLLRLDGQPTRIAHEAWDDEIPVTLPPLVATYGAVRMDPYRGDGDEKAARLAAEIAAADWICLPTPRLYSTILKVPERYPATAAYYRLLFAGELGFTLRATIYQPPELWGVRLVDLTADESHYVYDHPKAVIFEKTETLAPDEIERRILAESARESSLSRARVMLVRESPREQVANLWRDAYAGEAVLTREEVEARLARYLPSDHDEARRFLGALDRVQARPAVAVVDVRAAVQRMATVDRTSLGDLRRTLSALGDEPAFPTATLAALARQADVFSDRGRRQAVAQSFAHEVAFSRIARAALDARLSRVVLAPAPGPDRRPETATREALRPKILAAGGRLWELWQAVKWVIAVTLLGVAALPITLWIFSSLPDRGYPLARLVGWVVTTYVASAVVAVGASLFTGGLCATALLVVGTVAWSVAGRRVAARLPPRRVIVATEAVFLATFVAFALIRAYNPEIFWGEKPMDLSIYNAVMRAGTFPPYEPWFSGYDLNYYYYGYFLIAALTHLTGTPTAVGYNLAMAAIPALTLTAAFSVAYNLTGRVRWALAGVSSVGLIGNLDPLFQGLQHGLSPVPLRTVIDTAYDAYGRTAGTLVALLQLPILYVREVFTVPPGTSAWDSYWATSRAIGDGMINEYPLWSWLFADLHAHVIVMPVSLLCLSLVALVFRARVVEERPGGTRAVAIIVLLALALGTQSASNTWDFLAYGAVLTLALGIAAMRRPTPAMPVPEVHVSGRRAPVKPGRRALAEVAFVVSWVLVWPALTAVHPYWLGLFSDRMIGLGVALTIVGVGRGQSSLQRLAERGSSAAIRLVREALVPALVICGTGVLLFAAFYAGLDTGDTRLRLNADGYLQLQHVIRHFGFFVLLTLVWAVVVHAKVQRVARLAIVALLAFAALFYSGTWQAAPGLAAYFLLVVVVLATLRLVESPEHVFCATLLLSGWGLAAVAEVIVLSDRMNTVFKLYHPVWTLLALGNIGGLAHVGEGWRPSRRAVIAGTMVVAVALSITLAGTYRAVVGVVTRNLKISSTPTLNGLDFLEHSSDERELLEAVRWFDQHVDGVPVVAEAFTNRGYDDSARVAKYTGLPIVLGWPHHVKQRGRTPEQVAKREGDLYRLYTTDDAEEFSHLAGRYEIRYLFAGDLERAQYGDGVVDRLRKIPHVREVFRSSSGAYVVFEVNSGP